jgi:hypothetical protein
MHKYWGRKAHNLIEHLILKNTEPGDVVLDPYLGSGVSVIEANKANRIGIGYDLNPISSLITRVTLTEVDTNSLERTGREIISNMPQELVDLSWTVCPECRKPAKYNNAVWEYSSLTRIKVSCDNHGLVKFDARNLDLRKVHQAEKILARSQGSGAFPIPDPELFSFVRRSGVKTLRGLFSSRNLAQIAYLSHQIDAVADQNIRDALRITFTSMLPNVSSMIPADPIQVTGKSGWQISKFWVPKVHTEKDVTTSFLGRLNKISAGIQEMNELRSAAKFETHTQSSSEMKHLESQSVKLIIADPPYGDSIAYLGLSMFWNAWFDPDVAYESEVIIDSTRGKGIVDYANRLRQSFQEMRRVIRSDGKLIVTFNNRHMKFWKPLIQAIDFSGFELVRVEWIDQAVRSGTQGINHQNTLHGDFVYTYKPSEVPTTHVKSSSGSEVVRKTILKLLKKKGLVSSAELYVALIPNLVRAMAFEDTEGKDLDIDKEVSKYCVYNKQAALADGRSGWSLRDDFENN